MCIYVRTVKHDICMCSVKPKRCVHKCTPVWWICEQASLQLAKTE